MKRKILNINEYSLCGQQNIKQKNIRVPGLLKGEREEEKVVNYLKKECPEIFQICWNLYPINLGKSTKSKQKKNKENHINIHHNKITEKQRQKNTFWKIAVVKDIKTFKNGKYVGKCNTHILC